MKTHIALLTCIPLSYCIPGNCEEKKRPVSEAPTGRVNYPSNFQVEGGWNLLVFGEYLYWTANEDGLYFAQTGFQNDTLVAPPGWQYQFQGQAEES